MEAQVHVSQWLGQVAALLPFGYAFGAGMVSAVNPCGFAMLPVYLSLYLGASDESFGRRPLLLRMARAIGVAAIVTTGYGALFGLIGAVVSAGGSYLMGVMPWLAVVVGAGLVLLGGWMLFGHTVTVYGVQKIAARIGDPREMSIRGFFLFGVAFGATSLSCTLPIFLMVVGSSMAAGNFLEGLWQFTGYVLGTGAVLTALTLGIALVKEGVVVGVLRRALPYVEKVSALLLLLAGCYIIYYWLSSGLLLGPDV